MSSSAERMRRLRRREAKGTLPALAEIPQSLGITLIQSGLLSEQDCADVYKCGEALIRYLNGLRNKM